jgi:hypothetical protein
VAGLRGDRESHRHRWLEQCTHQAVRPGQTFSRTGSIPGSAFDIVNTVTGKTVYVDIVC